MPRILSEDDLMRQNLINAFNARAFGFARKKAKRGSMKNPSTVETDESILTKTMDQLALVPTLKLDSVAAAVKVDDRPPVHLICPMCDGIVKEAVLTPCCQFSLCNECLEDHWLNSQQSKCPNKKCAAIVHDLSTCLPNVVLREAARQWLLSVKKSATTTALPKNVATSSTTATPLGLLPQPVNRPKYQF